MSLFTWLVVKGLPLVPKPIVGRVAKRYVAGDTARNRARRHQRPQPRGRDGHHGPARRGGPGSRQGDPERRGVRTHARGDRRAWRRLEHLDQALGARPEDRRRLLPRQRRAHPDHRAPARQLRAHRHGGRVDHRPDAAHLPRSPPPLRATSASCSRPTCGARSPTSPQLPAVGANVRLCKGIYIEPRTIAFKGYETVRLQLPAGAREAADARRLRRHRDARRAPGAAARSA